MLESFPQDWLNGLIGGLFIGAAASIMLVFNGRVTGISGILYRSVFGKRSETTLFAVFIMGLVFGGLIFDWDYPELQNAQLETGTWTYIAAGLLVGFGTLLGGGCTSGHGVCGIGRLSIRSIAATVTFVLSGMLFVALFKSLGVYGS
ncbi:MAG: YeeE/YedE family protein [Pseudobdellovibrio sp.]